MEEVKFENAYYIKLGEAGRWANPSISNGIVAIGWSNISLEDINTGNWNNIRTVIKQYYDSRGKKTGSTQDFEALKRFCEATEKDVFITFYKKKMYWCSLNNSKVEKDDTIEDTPKFRRTINGWSCNPINDPEKVIYSNEISGRISKTQAFQGTLCRYKDSEIEIINRIICGNPNPDVAKINNYKNEICILTTELLKHLYWKDCEILTDLIFMQSGWRRISMLGGSMELTDMEYFDSINNEKYAVQVKSGAKKNDVLLYKEKFVGCGFRKLFFVAFNPDENLIGSEDEEREDVVILCREKLATLLFDLGLLDIVLKKSF